MDIESLTVTLQHRWCHVSTLIIEHWLDGKTLDQVLAKSHDLGHDTLPLGKELFYWYQLLSHIIFSFWTIPLTCEFLVFLIIVYFFFFFL